MCQLRMLATGEFSEVGISKNIKFDVPFAAAIQNYAHYYPIGLQARNLYFLYRNVKHKKRQVKSTFCKKALSIRKTSTVPICS